jgi:NADH-quinone oxidoreductase subunit J
MNLVFYLSAVVAVISTILVITRANAMHALLYLIVSLLAVALMFFTLGAPFVAALEVIVYAGAIMVLFIFAIMLLNQGPQSVGQERQWLKSIGWVGPAILSLILLGELVYALSNVQHPPAGTAVDPRMVGAALFSTYLLGVELSSILLLAGLVGAFHLGQSHQVNRRVERMQIENQLEREFKQPQAFKASDQKTGSQPVGVLEAVQTIGQQLPNPPGGRTASDSTTSGGAKGDGARKER